MFQIKVDVEGNEITDQAATAAVSARKGKKSIIVHISVAEADPEDQLPKSGSTILLLGDPCPDPVHIQIRILTIYYRYTERKPDSRPLRRNFYTPPMSKDSLRVHLS
jgi:hypothetical protein